MSKRIFSVFSPILCAIFGHVPGYIKTLYDAGQPYARANRPCRFCGADDIRPYVGDWRKTAPPPPPTVESMIWK